jgi:hypothetical protein
MEATAILFKEYDTLRAEIISRTNNIYQVIGIGAALGIAVLSRPAPQGLGKAFWVTLSIFSILIVSLWGALHLDISRTGGRLREIEAEVNAITGHELLKWETHWGRSRSWIVTRAFLRRSK